MGPFPGAKMVSSELNISISTLMGGAFVLITGSNTLLDKEVSGNDQFLVKPQSKLYHLISLNMVSPGNTRPDWLSFISYSSFLRVGARSFRRPRNGAIFVPESSVGYSSNTNQSVIKKSLRSSAKTGKFSEYLQTISQLNFKNTPFVGESARGTPLPSSFQT